MDGACIPYTRVPHSSALLLDYLYHFERVAPFFARSSFDPAGYQTLAAQLQVLNKPRAELGEVLARQNAAFGCSEATAANLRRLKEPGTFAVVTGQQVGLFSGPAFTLFKALTAVRLAQSLTEQGLPSVPVFWLATEDHDLEEVAEASVLDEEYNLVTLQDHGERPAPRSPVGQVKLTTETLESLERLETALPAGPPRDQLLHDLRDTFLPGTFWGLAFARFMAKLFGRWGVILLDPLDEAVHRLSLNIYKQALDRAADLRARVLERSQVLVRQGYHAQVHVAEDSTFAFVMRAGDRVAIHQRGADYFLDGQERVSSTELETWLRDRPWDFSPNVLLRPLVQDTLLPTLAYIAGPSELAYLAQAQPLYHAMGQPQPIIYPRAGFTLIDSRTQRLLEKYGIGVEDVWLGEEHLRSKIAATALAEGWSHRFAQSERDLAQLLERLQQDIQRLDPTLLDTLQHVKEKMTYQMERLKGKLTRAAVGRSELLARHEQALRRFLAPHKDLQERRVGGIYFLGRAGYELLDRLLSRIQSQCTDHQVLAY
jgi:bacillithiol synthase